MYLRPLSTIMLAATILSLPLSDGSLAAPFAPIALAGTASAPSSMEQAINMAGRQRMLSQRIVKAYSQLQMSLVPVRSRKELTDATALFESQSQSLQRYVGDEKIRKALAIVDVIWWDFKKLISVKNSQADPRDLYYLSEDLLYASDKVVQLLQDKSENQLGRLVNISGRQRMLSQRLAKLYLLQDEGLDSTSVRAALEDAQHDFSHALELLRVAPANTDEIKVELDKVILQWAWFQNVLQQEKTGDYQLIVVDASEEILRLMENITGLYSSLGQ